MALLWTVALGCLLALITLGLVATLRTKKSYRLLRVLFPQILMFGAKALICTCWVIKCMVKITINGTRTSLVVRVRVRVVLVLVVDIMI